jgi:hypothetical protein
MSGGGIVASPHHFVDGERATSGERLEVRSPIDGFVQRARSEGGQVARGGPHAGRGSLCRGGRDDVLEGSVG